MSDLRTTQEIFGDLFSGLASLGARGVDGLVMSRALARLLINKNLITKEEYIETMKAIVEEEKEREANTTFLLEAYEQIIQRLKD